MAIDLQFGIIKVLIRPGPLRPYFYFIIMTANQSASYKVPRNELNAGTGEAPVSSFLIRETKQGSGIRDNN